MFVSNEVTADGKHKGQSAIADVELRRPHRTVILQHCKHHGVNQRVRDGVGREVKEERIDECHVHYALPRRVHETERDHRDKDVRKHRRKVRAHSETARTVSAQKEEAGRRCSTDDAHPLRLIPRQSGQSKVRVVVDEHSERRQDFEQVVRVERFEVEL